MAASKWQDVIEMIQAQDLDVLDSKGNMVNERFLEACAKAKEAEPQFGLASRWMTAVSSNGTGVELQLQMLPCR